VGAFEASYASAHATFPPSHEIDKRFVSWPHNALVEMLLEKGLAGVVSLIVAAGWLYRRSIGTVRIAKGESSFGRPAVFVSAFLFILLAFVEASIHRLYFPTGTAAIMGALVACSSHRVVLAGEDK
jgi:O-antigen ligase